jgi:hypothetical protein
MAGDFLPVFSPSRASLLDQAYLVEAFMTTQQLPAGLVSEIAARENLVVVCLGTDVRQAGRGNRNELRDPAANPRRRRAQ